MDSNPQPTTSKMPGTWQNFWRALKRVLREPLGALGLVLVVFVLVSAIGADWWHLMKLTKSISARNCKRHPQTTISAPISSDGIYFRVYW